APGERGPRRRNITAMPSMAHEILVDLFKNRPSLAAEILVEVLGLSLPPYTEARLASTDLTEIQPAEYRADTLVVLPDPHPRARPPLPRVGLSRGGPLGARPRDAPQLPRLCARLPRHPRLPGGSPCRRARSESRLVVRGADRDRRSRLRPAPPRAAQHRHSD